MQVLAHQYKVDLVPGPWTVAEAVLLYNQAVYLASDGSVIGSYRKINLWETEKGAITPGPAVSVFPSRFGKVGLIICWDLAFPAMFAPMVAQGVELIVSPTYWSFPPPRATSVEDVREDEFLLIDSLCTARAFENNVLLAY